VYRKCHIVVVLKVFDFLNYALSGSFGGREDESQIAIIEVIRHTRAVIQTFHSIEIGQRSHLPLGQVDRPEQAEGKYHQRHAHIGSKVPGVAQRTSADGNAQAEEQQRADDDDRRRRSIESEVIPHQRPEALLGLAHGERDQRLAQAQRHVAEKEDHEEDRRDESGHNHRRHRPVLRRLVRGECEDNEEDDAVRQIGLQLTFGRRVPFVLHPRRVAITESPSRLPSQSASIRRRKNPPCDRLRGIIHTAAVK